MKRLQAATICLAAALCAHACAEPAAPAKGASNPSIAVASTGLQGTWEGFLVGETNRNITITITNNSLHFHRDTNFWFETTFTQPAATVPKQLHATIKDCATKDGIGKVVVAIYKIEADTLTLVALGDQVTPKSFEASEIEGLSRYELRKVQPSTKNSGPPNAK